MSAALKKRARRDRDRELDRLHRRLNSPRPDLPILRTAERHTITPSVGCVSPSSGATHHTATAPEPMPGAVPAPATPPTQPDSALIPQHSALPEWTRLLPFPAGLPAEIRRWIIRHIHTNFRPDPFNSTEQHLAARLALAMAHQHLAAAREPDRLCTTWLRYEAMADRQYRHAMRDWLAHQKEKAKAAAPRPSQPCAEAAVPRPSRPCPTTPATQISALIPHPSALFPQTPPNLPDTTFAPKINDDPDSMTTAETLAELQDLLTLLNSRSSSSDLVPSP